MAELVQAYGRLLLDASRPVTFGPYEFAPGTVEAKLLNRLSHRNPTEDVRVLSFLAAYGGLLEHRHLPPIFSVSHLCRRLGLKQIEMERIVATPRQYYSTFQVPKHDGSTREIMSPNDRMRRVQQWIHHRILKHRPAHPSAHGFTSGRSIATNAALHVGKEVIVRIDVRNFFPSVRYKTVRRVFQKAGYSYSVACALAGLCTVDGGLPQGAITSPALANLACARLDARMSAIADKLGCTYSRYADDLVFSSLDRRLPAVIPFLYEVVRDEGFDPNLSKTRATFRSRRQVVTGVVVNDRPSLPREHVRRLRAAAHRLRTQGQQAVHLRARSGRKDNPIEVLHGHLAFLRMVKPGAQA
jgi:retron-type reverse transcriptase